MYMTDFTFGEDRLTDFGYMIAYINTSPPENVSMGSVLNLGTVRNQGTYTDKIVNANYEENITATFDICINPCKRNSMSMTQTDISHIMRWLNTKQYQKFCPIYSEDGSDDIISTTFYYGTFTTIEAITIGSAVVGFTLTFSSNSPFGYAIANDYTATLGSPSSFYFYNDSDELGFLYPSSFILECSKAGNYRITNSLDEGRSVYIKNVSQGETISMDCVNKIITTNNTSHEDTLFNDFNYAYPRLVNTISKRMNLFTITVNDSGDASGTNVRISHAPIRKVGIIV